MGLVKNVENSYKVKLKVKENSKLEDLLEKYGLPSMKKVLIFKE